MTEPKKITAADGKVLTENVHFYMDGKYFVFMAQYHLERGYCCESRCRHCPYKNASIVS